MYVKTEVLYPQHLTQTVGKAWIEAMTKYPQDRTIEKAVVKAAVEATTDGFKVISYTRAKPGKLQELLDLESNRLLLMAKVEGFTYSITVAYEASEAMAFLGMESPI